MRTNPYEGERSHGVCLRRHPGALNWHFTDRYYHTNQDRPEKTSAAEMEHVGVSVATTAWFLASAKAPDASAVADLVEAAAVARLALERDQGRAIAERAADRAEADATQATVVAAWTTWYREALDSVLTLPPGGAGDDLRARVETAKARLK